MFRSITRVPWRDRSGHSACVLRTPCVALAVSVVMAATLPACGGSPACTSRVIGTWHDGPRTYAVLHDFGPVTEFFVLGPNKGWEIRAVGAPRPLTIVQLGTVP